MPALDVFIGKTYVVPAIEPGDGDGPIPIACDTLGGMNWPCPMALCMGDPPGPY